MSISNSHLKSAIDNLTHLLLTDVRSTGPPQASGTTIVTCKQITTRKAVTEKEQKPVLAVSASVNTLPQATPEA